MLRRLGTYFDLGPGENWGKKLGGYWETTEATTRTAHSYIVYKLGSHSALGDYWESTWIILGDYWAAIYQVGR